MKHYINIIVTNLLFLCCFCISTTSFAQYTNFRLIEPREGNEPQPRAILWSKDKARALIHYNDEHINVVDGVRIDKEWRVKEIKHESIVFGRVSEKRYIEYYIDPSKRPQKKYGTWSFYGLPITIWQAVQILCDGFEYNAVMHNLCSGAVVPHHNGENFKELLYSLLPQHNSARLDGDTLYIFPTNPPIEKWTDILNRRRKFNHKILSIRFPSLEKEGVITSAGYDIQYILRVISLGGEVPISFPKNLHFNVYANYKKVPFSKILCDIVYTNQCIIIEREDGLEVIPWLEGINQPNTNNMVNKDYVPLYDLNNDFVTSNPMYSDEKSGSGPYPPPLLADPKIVPAVVAEPTGLIKDINGHPFVVQPYEPASIPSRHSGDSE